MVNKVILLGNVGQVPEVKTLESGVKVARLSLATNEQYKDKSGQRQTLTEWHNVVLWRGLAEVAEKYIVKGKQIYIEGKLTTRKYQDSNGVEKYTTEVIANSLQMLGGNGSSRPPMPADEAEPQSQNNNNPYPIDEDAPF